MKTPTPLVTPITRRSFVRGGLALAGGAAMAGAGLVPRSVRAHGHDDTKAALAAAASSPLIYVSPLKSGGLESRCHGEVWFVADGRDLLVVTDAERWRAACIAKGHDQARIWVGDYGVWTRSQGAFRKAPSYVASARLDRDPAAHARALEVFGRKYAKGWSDWGPRFRDGLASGKRVMIRYSPAA